MVVVELLSGITYTEYIPGCKKNMKRQISWSFTVEKKQLYKYK